MLPKAVDGDPDEVARLRKQFELIGAKARLAAIDEERDRILALFPELAPRKNRKSEPAVVFDAAAPRRDGSQQIKRGRYTEAQKRDALARIEAGGTVADVARVTGIGDGALYYWQRMAGQKPLSPSEVSRTRPRKKPKSTHAPGTHYSEEFRKAAVARSKTGKESIRAIARDLGIGDSVIHQWRARAGISGSPTRKELRAKPPKRAPAKRGMPSPEAAWQQIQRPALAFIVANDGQARSGEIAKKFGCSIDAAGHRGRSLAKRGWATIPEPGLFAITEAGRTELGRTE